MEPHSIQTACKAPELLAPAGDWEAMRAAVANGADAVYFGLSAFNARHRAANFTLEELPAVMEFLHGRNVRGYVTLNTLIFSDELDEVARFVKAIAENGADAVIVQDLGLVALIARLAPSLPVHGSTQMTLTEPLGIEFVARLGVCRAILARELSLDDIRRIAAESTTPLEVFVHGALCISYSGQCLTSESLGGRSANRGQCAQACRLPYDLIVDGQKRELGDKHYLLSPQDLAAFDVVDKLAGAGVACLKIEGRLKSPQYVAAATQTYRAAVNAAAEARAFNPTAVQRMELAQSFSRGFTHGFFDGVDHQKLVHARYPKSRGVKAGVVVAVTRQGLLVRLERGATLKNGDGVVLDEGRPEQDEQGGRIIAVTPRRNPAEVEIQFHGGDVNLGAVDVGCAIFKSHDPEVQRRLSRSYSRDRVIRPARIDVDVTARLGEQLHIVARDEAGRTATVSWDRPLEQARNYATDRKSFCEQFGRLGDTPFVLGELRINGDARGEFGGLMIPRSVLNDLRRQATAELIRQRTGAFAHAISPADALAEKRAAAATRATPPVENSSLYVLVRSIEQFEAALKCSPAMLYLELEDIRKYPDAVSMARDAGVKIALATVRVIKPPEHGLLKSVAAAKPDAILVRNLAGVSYFTANCPEIPLIGDYSLNIANELTAAIFADCNLARMTPSYDLTWRQLEAMLGRFSPAWFEMVVHQQMPMFHMEHCVFAHTLSGGKDFRDCGRPCELHKVDLRDRAGARHALVADVGCRNTVYNGAAQSAAEFIPRMRQAGIRHFRIELLRQTAEEVAPMIARYAKVIAGEDDGRATWRQLRVLSQLGVTRGTLE